jgi:hypothetical protein
MARAGSTSQIPTVVLGDDRVGVDRNAVAESVPDERDVEATSLVVEDALALASTRSRPGGRT